MMGRYATDDTWTSKDNDCAESYLSPCSNEESEQSFFSNPSDPTNIKLKPIDPSDSKQKAEPEHNIQGAVGKTCAVIEKWSILTKLCEQTGQVPMNYYEFILNSVSQVSIVHPRFLDNIQPGKGSYKGVS